MEWRVKSTRFLPIQSRFPGIGPVRLVTRNTRIRTTPFVDNFVPFTSVIDASNARVVFPEMNRTRNILFGYTFHDPYISVISVLSYEIDDLIVNCPR